ncbi:hypothetical protein GQ457_06G028310 [Hibiscus cannabinus]
MHFTLERRSRRELTREAGSYLAQRDRSGHPRSELQATHPFEPKRSLLDRERAILSTQRIKRDIDREEKWLWRRTEPALDHRVKTPLVYFLSLHRFRTTGGEALKHLEPMAPPKTTRGRILPRVRSFLSGHLRPFH